MRLSPLTFRLGLIFLVIAAFAPARAMAQFPTLIVDDTSIFEGNSGTSIIKLPVHFAGAQPNTVTGFVSAVQFTANGFNPATAGTSCTAGVDFVSFNNSSFSIPPNTQNGTLTVNVTICGDTTIEPDEQFLVFFSNVSGALCPGDGCNAVATITNDDGPPGITIHSTAVSTVLGLERPCNFPVTLHHKTGSDVSVNFATRDGTAKAVNTNGQGAYFATSGTMPPIPAGSLSGTIPVEVRGIGQGFFFVDISNPVNGTIALGGSAICTISVQTLSLGTFQVTPSDASVPEGSRINYAMTWTVPPGEVWRNLNTIDLRFKKGNQIPLWVRWDEAANTFSLCSDGDDDGDDNGHHNDQECSAGATPGTAGILQTPLAEVYLGDSSVVGSGPTGTSVTLNLSIVFRGKAAGHLYDLELAATDDFGRHDDFVTATSVHVEQPLKLKQ